MKFATRWLAQMRDLYIPLTVMSTLAITSALTYVAWDWTARLKVEEARIRFEARARDIGEAIRERMLAYEQVLRGGVGLFAATPEVDRAAWRAYFESLRVEKSYPGIQGIGYSLRIPRSYLESHVRSVRAEGFPAYDVWPQGEGEEYTSIIYLEPFSGRNLRAFGYNMYSEAVRRAAMETARDSASAALTGRLILQQETDRDVQPGVLMYVPVYRSGMEVETIARRRNALQGYVYAAFRMNNLMEGILGRGPPTRLQVYDGSRDNANSLLYDSASGEKSSRAPLFTFTEHVPVNDRIWELHIASLAAFEMTVNRDEPRLVLLSGLAIGLLITFVVWTMLTRRQQAEALARRMTVEARTRRAEMEAINDSAPIGIYRTDEQGNCTYVNRAYEEITGRAADQALGDGWTRAVHPDDQERLKRERREIVAGHVPYSSVLRFVRPDGGIVWARINTAAIRVADRVLGYTGSIEDITQARRSEEVLRESRERLGLALEGSNLALFDWDVASGRVELSEHWARILGGAPSPTVTTISELSRLVHPDDRAAVRANAANLLRGTSRFYQTEHRVRAASGEWLWILSRAKVVERDAAGRALRVTGTNADISNRKEVERLKDEFIATVSHELRTPLTALVGALDLLDEQAAGMLAPDAAVFLEMARQNSSRLATLINDILDIEKIESGVMEFHLDRLALRSLLESAIDLNRMYAERLGVALQVEEPMADAAVMGDRDRLLQVLTNFVSNAAKYSPRGETVTLGTTQRDGWIRVWVSDRGRGVPETFRGRIFGKFAQADTTDSRLRTGTGLGLAISKAIVEKLGGRIGFDSELGKGSTFYFELPPVTH